jgi:uncharacterized membrane-anchored protein
MSKLATISISFWIMKICATTLGETAGDLLAQTMKVGYGTSSMILLGFFFITLGIQLFSKRFHPVVYWSVILATSTAGTTISDYMDRTLNLGYATGSLILIILLVSTLIIWKSVEKSLSVSDIKTLRGEIFYWTAILFSNTLGTAFGDFLADNSGLGFVGGAILVGSLLILIVLAYYFTAISHIVLFWLAFVLTRPFGATFGDLLTKPIEKGGLNFGTIGSSAILFLILIVLVIVSIVKNNSITQNIETKNDF